MHLALCLQPLPIKGGQFYLLHLLALPQVEKGTKKGGANARKWENWLCPLLRHEGFVHRRCFFAHPHSKHLAAEVKGGQFSFLGLRGQVRKHKLVRKKVPSFISTFLLHVPSVALRNI